PRSCCTSFFSLDYVVFSVLHSFPTRRSSDLTYLKPDLSKVTPGLIFAAMGQAFFSLSLGLGALITYGSYLDKKENIPQAAVMITILDVLVAFLAGLLIIPAIYLAQTQGITIYQNGAFIAGPDLIFQILPSLF